MNLPIALPYAKEKSWIENLFLVLGATLLITLFGAISIPLPFTPVPLATQATFCLFLALFLGSKRASLAVLLFLVEGAMGLPVFSLGKSGILHLMGPTGGYLFGMLLATYLTGAIYEKAEEKSSRRVLLSLVAGNLLIFLCGWGQLACLVGGKTAFYLGVLPFLAGDLFKLLLATAAFKRLALTRRA